MSSAGAPRTGSAPRSLSKGSGERRPLTRGRQRGYYSEVVGSAPAGAEGGRNFSVSEPRACLRSGSCCRCYQVTRLLKSI